MENIVGKTFNNWTVLEKTDQKQGNKLLYKCQCNCDEKTISYIPRTDLISGATKSCGCLNRKYFKGETVGNFIIKDYTHHRNSPYLAECKFCHSIKEYSNLRLEQNLSCGCLKISKGEYEIEQLLRNNNISY